MKTWDWREDDNTDGDRCICKGTKLSVFEKGSGSRIADLCCGWPGRDQDAHARLITAAPELLAACKLLLSLDDSLHMGERHGCTIAFLGAFDAIGKAEGRF